MADLSRGYKCELRCTLRRAERDSQGRPGGHHGCCVLLGFGGHDEDILRVCWVGGS